MITPRDKNKIKSHSLINNIIFVGVVMGVTMSIVSLIIYKQVISSLVILISVPAIVLLYSYFTIQLKKSERIRKMELIFPDFLQLMASNLRAGMTIDKSMLLSVREEFAPLDEEIQKTGRDIATGREIDLALMDMTRRIRSEKITKTIILIISGIRAGGNLAKLLEETSVSMRERDFIEKRAASNVLMYVIFIFVAVSLGAPVLFSLSTILVETLTSLLSGIGPVTGANVPFTLSSINVSVVFIKYFALAFIIVTDILACLVLGLVSKGEEKEGLKYLPAIAVISVTTFFVIRTVLGKYMQGLIAGS